MENMSVEEYKSRRREIEMKDARKGLIVHAVAITAVSALLVMINLTVTSEFLWFPFPVLGMSAGVAIHYVLGVRMAGRWISGKEMRIEEWR